MKKYLAYLAVSVVIVAAGCTDFGDENQLNLPAAPEAVISNIVAEADGDSITFTVAPAAEAGYYAWLVVESEIADTMLQADRLLKQLETGEAKGIVNYDDKQSAIIGVGGLVPFTVYQIYAVAATTDGVVSAVKNISVRTLDDGSKPTPQAVTLNDSIVTLAFHEPLQLGTGKVFVSYFAKNTVSGAKPLVVAPGFESFNSQDVEITADHLAVEGNSLVILLSDAPAGAFASITYEAGAVTDLEGNLSSAFTEKADTLISGAPSGGITVHLANQAWALYSEFDEQNPDTLAAFTIWNTLQIAAEAEAGITVAKRVATKTPTVVYNESGKTTTINVKTWGVSAGTPVFLLPEEPARGAVIDLVVPEGAFEDVYGNISGELTVENNYLYSYGYIFADVTGTYSIAMNSYFDGPLTDTGIIIDKAADSDTLLIKNLLMAGTEIKGVFDPVLGTISLDDEQLLLAGIDFGGTTGIQDIYFVNADASAPVVFNVPAAGTITSPAQMWGYYLLQANGWYDVITASTWTRTSTAVSAPAGVKAASKAKSLSLVLKPRSAFKR